MRDILVKYPITLLRTHLNKIRLSYANDLKGISKMNKTDVINLLIKYNFDINLLPPLKLTGKTRLTKEEKNLANVLSSALKNKRAKQNLSPKPVKEPTPEPTPEPTQEMEAKRKAKDTLTSALKTRKAKQILKNMKQSNYDEREKLALDINEDKPLNKKFTKKDKLFEAEVLKFLFKILKNFDKIKKEMMDITPDITKKNIDILNTYYKPEGKWFYKIKDVKIPNYVKKKAFYLPMDDKKIENAINKFNKAIRDNINFIVEHNFNLDYKDIRSYYFNRIFYNYIKPYFINSNPNDINYNSYGNTFSSLIEKYVF